ncbi:hypothetical protein Bpfe_027228, partial [Biomphalaria pfeifferi]
VWHHAPISWYVLARRRQTCFLVSQPVYQQKRGLDLAFHFHPRPAWPLEALGPYVATVGSMSTHNGIFCWSAPETSGLSPLAERDVQVFFTGLFFVLA